MYSLSQTQHHAHTHTHKQTDRQSLKTHTHSTVFIDNNRYITSLFTTFIKIQYFAMYDSVSFLNSGTIKSIRALSKPIESYTRDGANEKKNNFHTSNVTRIISV